MKCTVLWCSHLLHLCCLLNEKIHNAVSPLKVCQPHSIWPCSPSFVIKSCIYNIDNVLFIIIGQHSSEDECLPLCNSIINNTITALFDTETTCPLLVVSGYWVEYDVLIDFYKQGQANETSTHCWYVGGELLNVTNSEHCGRKSVLTTTCELKSSSFSENVPQPLQWTFKIA